MPNRPVEIPKGNGKVRTLQIPCIRDRVVQGALKLILEADFEADFCPNSYGISTEVMHLVKQIIKVGGKVGVPQGGPFSPLAANIYLNELDWFFDALRRKTAEGEFEAVNYHRFADDIVITVSGRHTLTGLGRTGFATGFGNRSRLWVWS